MIGLMGSLFGYIALKKAARSLLVLGTLESKLSKRVDAALEEL